MDSWRKQVIGAQNNKHWTNKLCRFCVFSKKCQYENKHYGDDFYKSAIVFDQYPSFGIKIRNPHMPDQIIDTRVELKIGEPKPYSFWIVFYELWIVERYQKNETGQSRQSIEQYTFF